MRALIAILVFIAATTAAWIAVMLGYGAVTGLIGYNDFEGSTAMGVAFFIGPVIAVTAGIAASIWFVRRRRPQQS